MSYSSGHGPGHGASHGANHGTWTIRPLADYAEMRRAVELQRVTWGANFDELVPPAVLWFTTQVGGIVAGAFAGSELIGLIFGVTGWDGERPVHWSDMLAVHPAARGRGIALELKKYQRERLLEQNVSLVNWTFDPLESRNAHVNFARLGVTSRTYLRDVYGASNSPLHMGIGTDRLVVDWHLASDRVRRRMESIGATDVASTSDVAGVADAARAADAVPADSPEVNPEGEPLRLDLHAEYVWLRIPSDIQLLKQQDEVAARRWRDQTRAAFEAYFGRGYEAIELVRGRDESRYLLKR